MPEAIPANHLRACPECNLPRSPFDEFCVACELDVEARPDDVIKGEPRDLQWRLEPEVFERLVPLMQEYLHDVDEGPVWVAQAQVPKQRLPAGYTQQERWVPVIRWEFGSMVKTMAQTPYAEKTITTLTDEGYGGKTQTVDGEGDGT